MRICPTCKTAYPSSGQGQCPRDGSMLVDAAELAAERGDPLIGTSLAGRFKILARIGTGGMGTVYRAHQAGLARQVALKVLKRELVIERETVARFHREAKAMSMLLHANTVRVFDFGEDPATGHLFLAMELLEGELLTSRLDREGALEVRDAIEFVREILRSLAEAHSKGIIHRDLKPDNIYLAKIEGHAEPVVKVLDFGIAKAFREEGKIDQLETQAGTVFGTPRYMSPEQAQGKALDPRSDLYSVGVLLYQLLTGRPPFVDDDAVVVMAKHIRDRAEPIRRAAPERPIPPSLERVVSRAMEKDPADRFANGEAFERALAACLPDALEAKAALESGRRSSLGGAMRSLPRLPLAIGGAVLVLASIIAAAVVASAGSDLASERMALASIAAPEPSVSIAAQESSARLAAPAPAAPEPAASIAASASAAPEPSAAIAVTPDPVPIEIARHVLIESDPPRAEIWREGARVGTTPHSFEVAPGERAALELRLEGYESATLELATAAASQTITLLPRQSPEPDRARTARRDRARPRHEEPASAIAPTPSPERAPPPRVAPPPRDDSPRGDPYERFE